MSVLAIDTASRSRVVVVRGHGPTDELIDAEVVIRDSRSPRRCHGLLRTDARRGRRRGGRRHRTRARTPAFARGWPPRSASRRRAACRSTASARSRSWRARRSRNRARLDWVVADAGRGAFYVARRSDARTPHRVLASRVRRRRWRGVRAPRRSTSTGSSSSTRRRRSRARCRSRSRGRRWIVPG